MAWPAASAARIRCRGPDRAAAIGQATLCVRSRPAVTLLGAPAAPAGANTRITANIMNQRNDTAAPSPRHAEADETNIRALVESFYRRVDDDPLLGPIFSRELTGRWDEHLAKMTTFWSSLVLGSKQYRGNVQEAHRPLGDIEPRHFARWLSLFLNTVESRYEPAAAVLFMEPALRIAQSLQLSKFGWDYRIPDEQVELLAALKRLRTGEVEPDLPARGGGEPFPARFVGRGKEG
jgi:hemoglobin